MALSLEMFDLLLYFVQQLGMMLGVGGECVILIAFLLANRDGTVTKEEKGFLRAIRRVVEAGLALIILSGLAIVFLHNSQGQLSIILQPAFLFKWALLAGVTIALLADRSQSKAMFTGIVGGTWLALFVVHVLAPVTTWSTLLVLYAAWMVLFLSVWTLVLHVIMPREKPTAELGVEKIPIPKTSLSSPSPVSEPIMEKVSPKPVVTVVPEPPPVRPHPIPAQTLAPAPKKPNLTSFDPYAGESFPLKTEPKGDTPMLHPHLTQESAVVLPTPPKKNVGPDGKEGLQFAHEHVTPHLPAVRIMPRNPEDLNGDHHRAPLVKYG